MVAMMEAPMFPFFGPSPRKRRKKSIFTVATKKQPASRRSGASTSTRQTSYQYSGSSPAKRERTPQSSDDFIFQSQDRRLKAHQQLISSSHTAELSYRERYILEHQPTVTIPNRRRQPPTDYVNNTAGESALRKAREVRDSGGDSWPWFKGAEGEELVGKYLEELNHKWRVLHSVTIFETGADIDHVVIGPPGVFVLNTKNHSGGKVTVYDQAIYVSREKQSYIKASESEAKTAHRALSDACDFQVFVTPVIVLIADIIDVKSVPNTVRVVESGDIVSWLRNHQRILTDDEVESIYAKARLSETWLP